MKKLSILAIAILCTLNTWADYVASVTTDGTTTTNYTSLESAFAAANVANKTSIVRLLSDVTIEGGSEGESYITLTAGVITFDLNNYTFDCGSYENAIKINGASVDIRDSGREGCITATANYSNTLYFCTGGLTIDAGEFKGTTSALCIDGKTTRLVQLRGGTFTKLTSSGNAIYVTNEKPISEKVDISTNYFADADGNEVLFNDGQYAINKSVTVTAITDVNAVASVTVDGLTTKFVSLASASRTAQKGTTDYPATFTVLKDVTCNDGFSLTTGVMTLDLNGKTITGNCACILTVNGADLTITDNTTDKAGAMVNTGGVTIRAITAGNLTILAGTFTGSANNAGFDVGDGVTVTLRGGRYIAGEGSDVSGVTTSKTTTSMLPEGYYYWDSNNNILNYDASTGHIIDNNNKLALDVKVAQLTAANAYASVIIGSTATLYTSFAEAAAVAAVDGTTSTITLLRDVTTNSVAFTAGNVTLDLYGKKLSNRTSNASEIIKISGNGNLTITDTDKDKKGSIENTYDSGYAINFLEGKLNINAGTFCASTALYAKEASTSATGLIVLRGGYFKTTSSSGSSITVPDASQPGMASVNWGLLNTDGYYLSDDNGNAVITDNYHYGLSKNVTVITVPKGSMTIVLDEDVDSYDAVPGIESAFTYDVTIRRSMKSGHWNSVCFPFSMTSTEIKESFGDQAKIMHIKDIKDDVIDFEEATSIEANEFYIVKPTNAVTEFELIGKTLTSWDAYLGNQKIYNTNYYISAANYKMTFTGLVEGFGTRYILSNDKLCPVAFSKDKEITMKAYRWSIDVFSNIIGSAKSLTSNIDLSDISTSIHTMSVDTDTNTSTYNLAGQRINSDVKGIVIKNGKKFMLK